MALPNVARASQAQPHYAKRTTKFPQSKAASPIAAAPTIAPAVAIGCPALLVDPAVLPPLLAAEITLDEISLTLLLAELRTLLASLLALANTLLAAALAVPDALAELAALDAEARIEDAEADADEPTAEPALMALETEEMREDCSERAGPVLRALLREVCAETRMGAKRRRVAEVNFMVTMVRWWLWCEVGGSVDVF